MKTTHETNLADFATVSALEALLEQAGKYGHRPSPSRWAGWKTVAEMAGVLAHGDTKSTEIVKQAHQRCADLALPMARSIKPVWQGQRLAGTRVDVNAALQGQPRAWGRYERQRLTHGTRSIALYIPFGGNANYSAHEIAWAPVAGIVIADLLENAGYRVEIYGCFSAYKSYDSNNTYHMRTLLKRSEDPVDVNALARIAHPGMLRCFAFARLAVDTNGAMCAKDSRNNPIDVSVWGETEAFALNHAYSLDGAIREIKAVISKFQE